MCEPRSRTPVQSGLIPVSMDARDGAQLATCASCASVNSTGHAARRPMLGKIYLRMCLGELDRARGETVDVRRRCRRHVGPEVVDHQQHHIGPGAAHRRARPDELGPDASANFAVIGDCVQVDCVRWGQIRRAAAGGSGFDTPRYSYLTLNYS